MNKYKLLKNLLKNINNTLENLIRDLNFNENNEITDIIGVIIEEINGAISEIERIKKV